MNELELNKQKVVKVKRVELLSDGTVSPRVEELDHAGQKLKRIARTVGESVFGIRTLRRIEATVLVEGKPVSVTSDAFGYSGITYIDGNVMTAEEARESIGLEPLPSYMRKRGKEKVIKTRTGNWYAFNKTDRNIMVAKRSK